MKKERLNRKKIVQLLAMSTKEAFDILEIDPKKDYDLKKAYRKASSKHHPDKGGDVEKMKQVNEAYELLEKQESSQKGFKTSREEWLKREEDDKKKNKSKGKIVKDILNKAINIKNYTTYLKKFIKEPLTHTVKITGEGGSYIRFTHEFFTKDRKTVFHITITVHLRDVDFSKTLGGGGSDDVALTYYSENYLYHNKRKQKMRRQTVEFKSATGDIIDPKKMFPSATLKKVFAGQKQRKFSKRDFEQGIIKELDASRFAKDAYKIPLMDDVNLYLTRTVMLRQGIWSGQGIYKKHKQVGDTSITFIPESEKALEYLMETIKKMRTKKDAKAMADIYNKYIVHEKLEKFYN